MTKIGDCLKYGVAVLLASFSWSSPAIAHTANDNWGHHMSGGFWAWVPMFLLWIVGLLVVSLLVVTLVRILHRS